MGYRFSWTISAQGVKCLLYVVDVFTKYAWVKPYLKYKKAKKVLHGFIEPVDQSNRKPNKVWE